MTDKITIERETLGRAIAYLDAPPAKLWPAGTLYGITSALRAALAAQPAEPVAHEFQDRNGKWCPFIDDQHYRNTVKDGSWPIRALYAAPAAVPPDERVRVLREALTGWLEMGYSREREAETLDLLEATK
jgi:hypothetical protein